jgi:hypothetical protein
MIEEPASDWRRARDCFWRGFPDSIFRFVPTAAPTPLAHYRSQIVPMLPERTVRYAGIVLIILGCIGLAYGGITYTRRRDTVSIGPITATLQQKETLPIPPIAGAIAVVAGIGLLLAGGQRRS